jgi:hypothetical protein
MFQEPRAIGNPELVGQGMAAMEKRIQKVEGPFRAGFCQSDSPEAAVQLLK